MQDGVEVWKVTGTKFSIAEIWKVIWPRKEKVSWHKLLWSSLNIPRHAMVVWMAILNRLPTKDRLISWGMEVNGICCLCQNANETRDHLFVECSYSKGIWAMILANCGISRVIGSWNEELQWAIRNMKGKQLVATLLRVAWKAFIYYIWKEKNGRLYGQIMETSLQVFGTLRKQFVLHLCNAHNRQLCNSWGPVDV